MMMCGTLVYNTKIFTLVYCVGSRLYCYLLCTGKIEQSFLSDDELIVPKLIICLYCTFNMWILFVCFIIPIDKYFEYNMRTHVLSNITTCVKRLDFTLCYLLSGI